MSARCTRSSSRIACASTATVPTSCGATVRAAARNACAPSDSESFVSGYSPCRRSSQYLEVPRQRLGWRPGGERVEHRRAQPVQPLVGVGLLGPLVEQLGEIGGVRQPLLRRRTPRRFPRAARQPERRPDRLGVIQPHQLAAGALEIGHPGLRERLERPGEARPRAARALGHATLLPPIPRQEHHQTIGLAQGVGAQNQGVGGVEGHEPRYFTVVFSEPRGRYCANAVARPKKEKNPNTSVIVVMKTDDASAGSMFTARKPERDQRPGRRGDEHVDDHRQAQHDARAPDCRAWPTRPAPRRSPAPRRCRCRPALP